MVEQNEQVMLELEPFMSRMGGFSSFGSELACMTGASFAQNQAVMAVLLPQDLMATQSRSCSLSSS